MGKNEILVLIITITIAITTTKTTTIKNNNNDNNKNKNKKKNTDKLAYSAITRCCRVISLLYLPLHPLSHSTLRPELETRNCPNNPKNLS